jgi:hypothetical protein
MAPVASTMIRTRRRGMLLIQSMTIAGIVRESRKAFN